MDIDTWRHHLARCKNAIRNNMRLNWDIYWYDMQLIEQIEVERGCGTILCIFAISVGEKME